MKVGDKIMAPWRPPLTWWDNLLWRLFRYERERSTEMRVYTIIATTTADNEQLAKKEER